MAEIKKPKWDECNMRNEPGPGFISSENVPFSAIDGQVENDMRVSAKYKGKQIHMKIITEISPDVFEAEIFGIEPNMLTYEDVSIRDHVEIHRQFISCIFLPK